MYDKIIVTSTIKQLINSCYLVLERFENIKSVDDFTHSKSGMEVLDSICMQLIVIGEGIKNLDKISENNLLQKYTEIDWKGAKAMRDIISHHYIEIDAEIIYFVCKDKIKPLRDTFKIILKDLL